MKKVMLFAVVALLVVSCGTTKYRVQGDCAKITTEELLKSINTVLVQNDFKVITSDTKIGYLASESNKDCFLNSCSYFKWTFQHNDGKVFASCYQVNEDTNVFGAVTQHMEIYMNDERSEKYTKYWNVRKALEKLCGEKLVVVELQK